MHIFREGGTAKLDNNDFILKIVAELEQKGIKTGFDKLKKELEKDPAKIDVILDTSGTVGKTKGSIKKLAAELHNELSVEISKLQKQGQDINFDLSVGDVEEVIQNVINHTKKLGESFDVASDKAQKFLAKFNKKSGGVLINSDEFKAVQEAINGLGNTHTIEDLNKAMNTLEVTYDNMSSKLRNSGKSLNPFINAKNEMATMDKTIEGISLEFDKLSSKPDDVANAIKELSIQQNKVNNFAVGTMEWADAYGHLQEMVRNVTKDISNLQKAQSSKSLQPRIDEIQLLSNGGIKNDYATQLAVLEGKFSRLGFKESEIAEKTEKVNAAFNALKQRISQPFDESNFQEIINLNDKLQKELIESQNELTKFGASIKMATDSSRLNAVSQMQKWADNNGKAMKKWGEQINGFISQMGDLSNPLTKLDSDDILREFKSIQAEAIRTGNVGMTTSEKFSNAWNKIGGWSLVTGAFAKIGQAGRKMYEAVVKVNSAMIELRKVSDASASEIKRYFDDAAKSAKRYGSTVSDMINATADFSRLGYSLPEASELAKVATLYKNVGDGINIDEASSSLVSTMKAFNITAEDSISIIDKLNEVGNNFSISSGEIGEALKRSASSLSVAGNSLSESIGLITAGKQNCLKNMETYFYRTYLIAREA